MRNLYSTKLAGQVRRSRFIFNPDPFTRGMFSQLNTDVEQPLLLRAMDA
jgi:hypothetical protein